MVRKFFKMFDVKKISEFKMVMMNKFSLLWRRFIRLKQLFLSIAPKSLEEVYANILPALQSLGKRSSILNALLYPTLSELSEYW